MTSELSVLSEVIHHSIEGIMFHSDLTNIFNFLNMKGFKREHLYRTFEEFTHLKDIENYTINHIGYLPAELETKRPAEIISAPWRNATKFQVNDNDRKVKLKEIYTKWKDWESDTKLFLQTKYQELVEIVAIASSCKIKQMILDVDQELVELEDEFIKYNAINWDITYIMSEQKELKEHFIHKLKNLCIEIC